MSVSRTDLQSMERDELIELVLDLSNRLEGVEDDVDDIREHAALDRAKIRKETSEARDDLKGDLRNDIGNNNRRFAKLAQRVSRLEEELGVDIADGLANEGSDREDRDISNLGRVVRMGPEAIKDNPTARDYRANDIVDNWDRWGVRRKDRRNGTVTRKLRSKKDDIKTHLEDERDENLSWNQVYRAMERVAEWSSGEVSLNKTDSDGYVLVHQKGSGGEGQ